MRVLQERIESLERRLEECRAERNEAQGHWEELIELKARIKRLSPQVREAHGLEVGDGD